MKTQNNNVLTVAIQVNQPSTNTLGKRKRNRNGNRHKKSVSA